MLTKEEKLFNDLNEIYSFLHTDHSYSECQGDYRKGLSVDAIITLRKVIIKEMHRYGRKVSKIKTERAKQEGNK